MTRRYAQLILGLTPVVIGVFIGLVFLITPLPTANWQGAAIAWCGPGATSDNAIQVLINPHMVDQSAGDRDDEQQATLRSFCVGEARTRVIYSGIADLAGAIAGLGLLIIALGRYRLVPAPGNGSWSAG